MALRPAFRVALVVAAPFLIVLFLLSLPIVLPIVELQQARNDKRKRALVERWPCGWCVAPLGAEALARADTLFGRYIDEHFDKTEQLRIVCDMHACCPRCNAGHCYDAHADRFVLHHPREFGRRYGEPLETVTSATMAWPWFPPQAAAHTIALTRDSVWGDDADAPHEGTLAVPAAADVAAIAEALLRSPWLAHVGGTASWSCTVGPVTMVFGLRSGMPFSRSVGADAMRADSVTALHVRYQARRDPDTLVPAPEHRASTPES